MKSFIYDRYGYYNEENKQSFEYGSFLFCLEKCDKSEQELEEINKYIISLSSYTYNKKAYIVPTRDNKLSALSEYGPVCLIGIEKFDVDTSLFVTLQKNSLRPNNKIKLSNIKQRWIEKLEIFENKIIPSLKVDSSYYQIYIISITFALGLIQNAIQYLEDTIIDYGDNIEFVSLTHKRINKLDSYNLLNPFNLIIDSPVRDLSELYKNRIISFDELIKFLKEYQIGPKEASQRTDLSDELIDYFENIDNTLEEIKKIHNYLVSNYGIRKISWLE